ncbi:MAG: hypothetical protein COB90_05280 [Hyphomicrobiales bacterium]|nr:MAG: hypothetical protein COB90_05280 [Hyphomicrobiales bacterium]
MVTPSGLQISISPIRLFKKATVKIQLRIASSISLIARLKTCYSNIPLPPVSERTVSSLLHVEVG